MSHFTISPAAAADYPSFVRLFPELAVPDAAPSAEHFSRSIVPDAIVLRHCAAVVGYAWARRRGDRLHVVHVITDPAHRRRGVGHALIGAVAERGRAASLRRWMLNVKPENVPARALYERFGLQVVFASVSLRIAWPDVLKVAPASSVLVRPLAPTDDARFEEALFLARGEVSSLRGVPGRIIVGAEGTGPVGFVAFDPSSHSASRIRALTPGVARALLDAIRPHVLPDDDHLLLFVEGDTALEAALTAVGAQEVMRALRMEGEIPL